jgi:iron complex transport system substrate-binding protein
MRRVGVPVIVVYPDTTDGALRGIELIGDAVGLGESARQLTANMEATFAELATLTANRPKPRVFYEIDASSKSYVISLETLVAADPEIIVLGDGAYGVTADVVAARPGWGGMTAVRDGAIHPVDDTLVTRPGPRLVDGLRSLIGAIHPEVELP